jgi:predicted acetyltransferase
MAADGFTFGTGLEPGMPWLRYLEILAEQQRGAGLPPSWVPGTFLVAHVAGEIVGRSSIRHGLTASAIIASAASGSQIRRYWFD